MKVLLVEDKAALRQAVTESLRQAGYLVEVAADFGQAREKIAFYQYDCVLLDLTLPDGDGLDLLRELKADNSPAGVLVLTARNGLADRINGLDLGADDYLVKPFHLSELNARIWAIIRRRQFQGQQHLVFRDMIVWPERNEVLVQNLLQNAIKHNVPGGKVLVSLTATELEVSNTGPAVAGDPARFFERFRKHNAASDSPGLGLSIVQHICAYYGFRVGYEFAAGSNRHTLRVRFS